MNFKIIAIIIFLLLIIFTTVWQFYSGFLLQIQPEYNTNGVNNSSDTVESISNYLNEIPDASSLDNELDSLDKSIGDF